jgi:hypothetical protein
MKISSSGAIWKIAAVTALAFAAEIALRRNRNRSKCIKKRSVSSMRTMELVSESPVGLDGEQLAETLRPSIPQTPETASALAAVPTPPEAGRLTEPSDEEIRLRAYFISEHRRRFALPGDADSDWREARQQLLSESSELSGPSMITKEEPREIPARTEEIAPPAIVTSAETEVIEEGQSVSREAYRKAEPDDELPPLTEPVFESPVAPAVEQTAETLRPSVPQTPETASAPAAVPTPPEAARLTEPSDEEIRAHVISEQRRIFALPGDADSDWREARQQLLSESGELSGGSAITTEEPSEIPARTEEIAPPAVVTSAETEVIEEGQVVSDEAYRKAEPDSELPAPTQPVSESPVGPDGEQTAETLQPSVPQTPEIAPALAAIPIPPEAARLEATQTPTAPVTEPAATAVAKSQPSGTIQTSVQLTFSFEIAAMRLTPTFKIGVLQVRPISKIVTMHLAPFRQAQLEVSFKIAKIQPVGETLGTIRVTPSQQRMPMIGSPSFMATRLQLVPNGEATSIQLMPSQQDHAVVSVTAPCRITAIEFSPLLEIASVVLNSSSKEVLVHLGGAEPSPAGGQQVFEITELQLSEGCNAGMIQLRQSAEGKWNGPGVSPLSMIQRFEDSPQGCRDPSTGRAGNSAELAAAPMIPGQ